MCSSKVKKLLLLLISVFFLVSGVLLVIGKHHIFMSIFKSNLVLGPSSGSFPMWHEETMKASMYLFKVHNPKEILTGKKPRIEQVGPYVFSERHEKVKFVWNSNGTVTYRQIRTWHFLPHLSNGTLDDEVTILNSVAASLGPMIQQKVPAWLHPSVEVVLKQLNESLFVTKTVREIIFSGYHDPIFDDMKNLVKEFPFIPQDGLTDKFAFFYQRNGTDYIDGVFNMYTGAGDVGQMGQVHSWNYTTQSVFPGECGKVRGSAGEFYAPNLQKNFIELFSNDLCRSIRLNYNRTVGVKGIDSYEFILDQSFFANGTENPENACFETSVPVLRSGLYDTSKCKFGAPVFVSQPHFYQADPYYLDQVDGLEAPQEHLHSTYLRIEPQSGLPTDVVVRFQMNVLVAPVSGIGILSDVKTTFFPVMWFENTAGIPDEYVSKMSTLTNLQTICYGLGWGAIGLAAAILVIAFVFHLGKKKVEEDMNPILSRSLQEESGDENVFTSK